MASTTANPGTSNGSAFSNIQNIGNTFAGTGTAATDVVGRMDGMSDGV